MNLRIATKPKHCSLTVLLVSSWRIKKTAKMMIVQKR
jgi:hypothetical protein